jgi:LysM domain.
MQPNTNLINLYNTNTGALLNPGQTYINAQGQTITQGTPLAPAVAPSNVSNITTVPSTNITPPVITSPDTTKANSVVAGSVANTSDVQSQLNKFYQQQSDLQTQQSTQNQSFLSNLFSNQTSTTDLTAQAEAKFGVNAQEYLTQKKTKEAEISSLTKDYQNTKTAMEEEKAKANDRLATTGSISREQAAIDAKYSPTLNRQATEINYQSALLSNLNGDFATAEQLVQQAVSSATADQKTKLDQALTFYQENNKAFDSINSVYKDAFTSKINLMTTQLNQATTDAKSAMQIGLDNNIPYVQGDTEATMLAKVQAKGGSIDYKNSLQSLTNANNNTKAPTTYTIASGDTLYNISQKKGITLSSLQGANPSVDPQNLRPGQVINIPTSSSTSSVDLKQTINQAISASGSSFTSASSAEQQAYIRSLGGNPSDYGY